MRSDRLKKKLAALHQSGETDQQRQQALETNLLNRYRQIHPRNTRWLMLLNPWNRTARFALVGLALMVLSVGACSTETTTQIEAGQQAHIGLKMDSNVDGQKLRAEHVQAITGFVNQQPNVDQVDISVNEMLDADGQAHTSLDLMIWGQDLDPEVLTAALQEDFPLLASADIHFEPLSTSITENWFDRLGRQVFNIEVGGASEEEIRAQILQQLAEQGFTGDATVDVINEDGLQEITIELEEEMTE